ncbi:4Fe-4S dicluster domain-containing protein [Alkaliphilus pronyensis]|uniref:4Fe-4S dicluster domain-containing protein n=1 Tax=Alkaliphilus pronyensis TaxID=1482732 RepID=A0A6I0F8Q4_9FIRM|nr:[Fe-Fe] hydrogenase large subunit C-terminal domain-containing protein [Alkaliphilus pronyensis]KAB3534458.1 4Fe-4S dicluster domain-containing protein [Alkaliphilus pronyensis]
MHSLIHAIALDPSKCVGCTNCIKHCPTEAIRVKNGQSRIIKERCINCGQCIQVCPRRARFGVTDSLNSIDNYKYKIALIDPVLYGQFIEGITPSQIIRSILSFGFDDFFETSRGADIITSFTKQLVNNGFKRPIISSACPTIVRLIQVRFPSLIEHILPIDSPVEISAHLAREKVKANHKLSDEEIGVFYITPCPARIFSFQKPVGIKKSHVNGTLSVRDVFLSVSKNLDKDKATHEEFYPSGKGIGWARTGGQSQALGLKEYLAVDGIQNVISVLEEIEYHKIRDLVFLECHACTNGCVGGSLTIENSFVSRNRIRKLVEDFFNYEAKAIESFTEYQLTESLKPIQVSTLADNLSEAIKKMEQIEKVLPTLPNIDCGACGAPRCRSLAEDIVLGYAGIEDCIVLLKKHISEKDNTDEDDRE